MLKILLNRLVQWIISLFKPPIRPETPPISPVIPEPVPIPPEPTNVSKWAVPVPSKAYGDYPDNLKRELILTAKGICLKEGLSFQMMKEVLATIFAESGFNPYCVAENKVNGKVTSIDYGVCQFNSRYYLKEYNMTPEYAITHPEDCIHIMARNFLRGRADNWTAYKNGIYLNFINKVNMYV